MNVIVIQQPCLVGVAAAPNVQHVLHRMGSAWEAVVLRLDLHMSAAVQEAEVEA